MAPHAQQDSAQARLAKLEQALQSRDRELVALRDELAQLKQLTQQLMAANSAA